MMFILIKPLKQNIMKDFFIDLISKETATSVFWTVLVLIMSNLGLRRALSKNWAQGTTMILTVCAIVLIVWVDYDSTTSIMNNLQNADPVFWTLSSILIVYILLRIKSSKTANRWTFYLTISVAVFTLWRAFFF